MAYPIAMQEENLRKGPWLEEEDERLTATVAFLGERRWDSLAKESGLRRSGKSCRLRWMNYLRPNLKHGQISVEEERIILQLHAQWGNKWSRIARQLPGRTDNEIKNYWRSHLRKKAQAQEQESFGSVVKDTKQNVLNKKCETVCISEKDDISIDSSATIELSNYAFANSPYEKRVSDWISYEQSGMNYHEDFCCLDSCFCYPVWISEGSDTSIWDCSSSIWDMN